MDLHCLPAKLHLHPERIPDAVERAVAERGADYARVFVVYADCGTGGLLQAKCAALGVEMVPGPHCYAFFEGVESFAAHDDEITAFYLTDFLVRQFDAFVWRPMGLDRHPELRDVIFGNYTKLVHQAQTDDPALRARAEECARRLGLGVRIPLHRLWRPRPPSPGRPQGLTGCPPLWTAPVARARLAGWQSGADLARFVSAQEDTWPAALAELEAGRKTTHWMWFIFPQLASLGRSGTARYYGIAGLEEARAYLAHPVLGPRLSRPRARCSPMRGRAPRRSSGRRMRSSCALRRRCSTRPGAGRTSARFWTRFMTESPVP